MGNIDLDSTYIKESTTLQGLDSDIMSLDLDSTYAEQIKLQIDETKNNVSLNTTKYDGPHMSQEDFLNISSMEYGDIFGIYSGREETMQAKLYEIYNPNKDEDGIQIEQFGAGNNVRVTLPNGEEEEFELSGVGGLFGDEVASVKEDHDRLVRFIGSDFNKLKINEEKSAQIDNIFLGERKDAAELWNDELDDNVAKELNLLGLSNDEGDYTFERSKWYRNAITITSPSGTEKTINIDGLRHINPDSQQKILNTVKRFIESDPGNYTLTGEYKSELKNIEDKVKPYLQNYIDNPEKAIALLDVGNQDLLKKNIKKDLEIRFWENQTFKDITRDQQIELVDRIVQNTIDGAMDKISLNLSNKERKDLETEGYDLKMVYDHVDKRTGNRFSGLNKQIFDLNLELDNEGLSEEERKKKVNEVNGLKARKAEKEGNEYSFLMDMTTMSRVIGEQDEANVINLSKEIQERTKEVQLEKLTRKELKERYVSSNLAYDEWEDRRNTDKHKFIIPGKKVEGFSRTHKDVEIYNDENMELMGDGTLSNKYSPSYVMMTDAEAGSSGFLGIGGENYWLETDENHGYLSRLQHGIDLKTNREVYDKVYGLNESVESSNVQGFWSSVGTNFVRGFTGKDYELENGITDDQFRGAFLDVVTEKLGIDVTAEEKEYAKTTFSESTGAAISGLPKMVADFWIGNKALAAVGVTRMVGSLIGSLKKGRYAIKVGGQTKNYSKTQLLKHIGNSGKSWKNGIKNVKPGTGGEDKIIVNWLKANKYGNEVFIPASILNQGAAVGLNSLLEGVKMEVAMQSPTSGIVGAFTPWSIGDSDDIPAIGSSFSTGFGFGMMGGIIPWNRMFTGIMGKGNVGKGLKIRGTKSTSKDFGVLTGAGGKVAPKEVSFKGLYDYLVVAPLSFYSGAQFGAFTNQIADNLMANKTWDAWMEENYSDWGHVLKHAATELITGLALKIGHGNKYDFASENKLTNLRRASRKKLREEVYENVVEGKDGKLYKKTIVNGVEMLEPTTTIYRKGKTKLDAEKYESLVSETTFRLHEMRDTKAYLDPIQGPIKFMEKWKPQLEDMGESKDFRFVFDESVDKMNIRFVKPGGKFHKGGVNNTGRQITEGTFNPKNVSVDYIPHELLHFGTYKKLGKKGEYSGEDVMFKNRVVDGLVEIAKQMEYGDGRKLYDTLLESGVLKEGRFKGEVNQTKEWELFSYIAEFYGKEGNQKMIEDNYGFDKLASFTDKLIKKEFSGANTPLNTQKDLVLFFGNYARNIGKGAGIKGSFKHLEKFVSPTKTKKQQEAREKHLKNIGEGETKELKTQNLTQKIVRKQEQLKSHPAFVQYKEDKDLDKYSNNPSIKKILSDLKQMRKNLENIPEDMVWGEESANEKKINDFARVVETITDPKTGVKRNVGRLMTEKEWNAKGGGKEKAMEELMKDGGTLDGIAQSGISFPIKGRSRETWLEDVKLGIPGVDKGLIGTIERFNYIVDGKGNVTGSKWGTPEQNESLSAWVNAQYQYRRGKISNHYEANPVAKPLDAPAGKGATIGERLLAGKDVNVEIFENKDMSKQWTLNKRGDFEEVVEIEGSRDVVNELPVDKKVFEEKGGWKETVEKRVPIEEQLVDKGYKDIEDLAPEFTEEMYSIELKPEQRDRLNDIGGETNRRNGQEFIRGEINVPVREKSVNKEGEEVVQQREVDGELVTKKAKNSNRIADVLPDGTIRYDKGVSDMQAGRSAFPRLGLLGELYHLATTKNYTRAELSKLGFETNEAPHKDGHWRARTGPGGRVYIKGKAKGQKLTGKDIEKFVGVREDGSLTKLSEDRSIGGKIRRLMSEDGKVVTVDIMQKSSSLNANILANLKGGKSRSFWSRTLDKHTNARNKEILLREILSGKFTQDFFDNVEFEKLKPNPNLEKVTVETIVNHFEKYKSLNKGDFTIIKKDLQAIAKELYKEFRFTGKLTPSKIATKVKKALKLPSTTQGVESKYGIKPTKLKDLFNNKYDIEQGQIFDRTLARYLTEKYGVGAYEVFMQDGTSSGGGIGMFSSIKDMLLGKTGTNRYSIWRSRNINKDKRSEMDSYNMIESIYAELAKEQKTTVEKLKKYEGITSSESYRQSDKMKLMKIFGIFKGGKWNEKQAKLEYEFGEKNKEVLIDAVEYIKDAYAAEIISHRVARQWVEMHAGNMFGLIKKSASLAVLPNASVKELLDIFPEKTVKINKKTGKQEIDKEGNKVYESNWVLEHMTPANYVKSRIYDYILSKGDGISKEAMDLTLRDYHTTFIPKKYDTMVNKTLREDLPSSHLPGMDPAMRYFGASHPADFNFGLRAFAGYRAGRVYDHHANLSISELQTAGKEVGKSIKKLFPEILRKGSARNLNSKNLEHLKNIDKAVANGRKLDQKRKGMSTWDFDDTLATTKSGVRATIPNPSGKPKPSRKVVFLAGGAGSGKGNVIKKLGLEKDGFKVVNSDISLEWLKKNSGLPENMNDFTKQQKSKLGSLQYQARGIAKRKMTKFKGNADGVVVDGTGGSIKAMESLVKEFKGKGYDVSMVFVETSLKTALQRNQSRKERSLLDNIVEKNHASVQGNKGGFKAMFGERFMEVKTDKLSQEDAMPSDLVSKMNDFVRGYEKIRLDAEEFATQGKEILDNGGKFDFGEFNVVTEGAKGPFFQKALDRAKKFGLKDQFVLTARPPEAAGPIHEFLKSQGLDIPLKNITGLGNSTGEAKALWMLEKFAEGYNDMYFADDALQNTKAVSDALKQVDVKSKVVQAKIQEQKDLDDVKDVDRLSSPDTFSKILNSRALRGEYEKTIAKHRPDLVKENLVSKTVDEMFDFIDKLDVPISKKKKYEQVTTKWIATSNIKLREDAYKIKEAVELAEKHKEDIFSYKNPNELIEKYAGKAKAKPTDPRTVKEFAKGTVTNKKHGITEHVVADTREGQAAVRKVMDTHFGPKSNPWCLAARSEKQVVEPRQYGYELSKTKQEAQARKEQLESEGFIVEIRDRGQNIKSKPEFQYDLSIKEMSKGPGEMEGAWKNWETYSDGPKSMVFQNGKLIAFKASKQYWDRMDNATDAPVITMKEGRITKKVELVPLGGGKVQEFVRETRTVSKDKNTVTTEYATETENYEAGTIVVENRVNGTTVKKTTSRPSFDKQGNDIMQVLEVVNYDKKGKATSNKNFEDGELIAINTYGRPFGEMKPEQIIKEKGDQIEFMGTNRFGRGDYFVEALVGGKIVEIGFELGRGIKLESVIKTSPDGKIRLDLEKVIEANPEARAMVPGVRPTTLAEIIKPAKPVAKEGMQALEPVKQVLDQLDVKSEAQQARSLNTKNLSKDINDMMEHSLDIESKKVYSFAEAKVRGKDIKRRRLLLTDSAADLELLIEPLYGKGKKGIENKKWFEDNFYKPWERSVNDLNTARQTSFNDYATLRKQNKETVKSLQEPVEGTAFTNDMAARVYIYNKAGFKIPGLAKTTEAKLVEYIRNNPELLSYAENVVRLTGIETGLSKPGEGWWAETLATEVQDIGQGVSRKRFLQNWTDIKNEIFSTENLNKMESKLGTRWRSVIEDMFDRMETGRTRGMNLGPAGAEVMNYLNGSVGTIMNLNTRSATLQLISSVNFINHAENNPLAAARAFANQPQYWKDFMTIMNSDMLVQRRAGLKINVTEAELASAASESKNKARAAISWILKQGYLPTKIADSFAISSGGATYYRNRIRMYEKQGLETKEAEKKAFLDFQATAEKTQQSSRPDLLSQQQTSFIGRLVLPFANTPMQMNRIMGKEILDLSKGRWKGFVGENSFTHKASKIAYYGVMQSIIFAGLQSALFATMGFDPESDAIEDKTARSLNTVLDSFLRGMGWQTAVVASLKNAILEAVKQDEKGFNADYSEVAETLLNLSPTIGSKFSKLDAMGNTYKYNKKEIKEKGFSLDNTPLLEMTAQGTEAIFNIPINRLIKKADNIEGALNEQNEAWQRVLMILGWSKWDVGVEDAETKKQERKDKKNDKPKEYRRRNILKL